MPELTNDRYLRAILQHPVDITQAWIMRQWQVVIYLNIEKFLSKPAILSHYIKILS